MMVATDTTKMWGNTLFIKMAQFAYIPQDATVFSKGPHFSGGAGRRYNKSYPAGRENLSQKYPGNIYSFFLFAYMKKKQYLCRCKGFLTSIRRLPT